MTYRNAIVLLMVALVAVVIPAHESVSAYSNARSVALKKTCRIVTKKIHGKSKKVKVCKTVAAPAPITPTPTTPATGTFTPINDPQGAHVTYVFFVSTCCGIAGSYRDAQGTLHGFVYQNKTYTTVDDPQAISIITKKQVDGGSQVQGANAAGDLIGFYGDSTGAYHGFDLRKDTYTTLDNPQAGHAKGQGTFPAFINAAGEIVGTYVDPSGLTHGFLLHQGTYSTIDDPHGGTNGSHGQGTQLSSITDSGDVVGYFQDSKNVIHGFVLHAGTYTTLDDLKAGTNAGQGTMPASMNNQGKMVGNYVDSTGQSHGFTWESGTFRDFWVPGNELTTSVTSIDDAGDIAGFTGLATIGPAEGFLYKP